MSSVKRRRTDEEEACEALGGLLRQNAARAVERVRVLRQQRSGAAEGGVGVSILSTSAAEAVVRAAKPMDVLTIRFCAHYLDCSNVVGATHFIRLAQSLVTSSVERVLVPQLFAKGSGSFPAQCEALVAEHTAEDIQTAVKEINEFVEARGALGAWLTEASQNAGRADGDDDDDYEEDTYTGDWDREVGARDNEYDHLKGEEEGADADSFVASGATAPASEAVEQQRSFNGEEFGLASALYKSCEFWVRVQAFLHALSLHSARLHVFKMPPRYEKELLLLLYNATRGVEGKSATRLGVSASPSSFTMSGSEAADFQAPAHALDHALSDATLKDERGVALKAEPVWDMSEGEDARSTIVNYTTGGVESENVDDEALSSSSPTRPPQELYKASALLADVLALSRCPEKATVKNANSPNEAAGLPVAANSTPPLKGIDPEFYKMVYARLGVMVARDRLHRFDQLSTVAPPELTVQQRNLQTQLEQQRQQYELSSAANTGTGLAGQMEAGLPTNYVPDDAYFDKLLHQQHDIVEEDEEVYKGEVMDYYLSHPGRTASTGAAGASAARSRTRGNNGEGEAPLMKPHRFCKVKTGFSWTQYNRTHYDSRTNPPPRTEMWYEFTLFYPALANTKRDMRRIFRIEDAPEGPNDQYCLLVFSVGPPYADVAYRIRKKQWDTRRGGVRISFDQTGRYKLFFRFTNSNYRR